MENNEDLEFECILLSKKEAAEKLHISTKTLDRFRENKAGPPYLMVGGQIRYKLSSLYKWINSQEAKNLSKN